MSDFKLAEGDKVKTGIKQMITQAWDQRCRDRAAVSKSRFEVFEALSTMYEQEPRDNMNETFVLEVDFPNPFVTEVYTDTEPVARSPSSSLRAGQSVYLGTGWDFTVESYRQAGSSRSSPMRWSLLFRLALGAF